MTESAPVYAPTLWQDSAQASFVSILTPEQQWIKEAVQERAEVGKATYGGYLAPGNPGRDGHQDLVDELLDAAVYAHERWMATDDLRYALVRGMMLEALSLLH